MDQAIVISGILMSILVLLALWAVRRGRISLWLAFGIVSLVAAISGLLIVYFRGDPLIGVLCLSPLLAFGFGVPVLVIGFVLRPKK
mgnify:CR=1 FL=1